MQMMYENISADVLNLEGKLQHVRLLKELPRELRLATQTD